MKNYSDLLFYAVTFLPGLSGSHVFADTIFNAEYLPAGARDLKKKLCGGFRFSGF